MEVLLKNNCTCTDKCWDCTFWEEKYNNKNNPAQIVVNGVMYYICPKTNSIKGFDGRQFRIKSLKNGVICTTNNLWCNGEIPSKFLHLFPNTGEFI